MAEISQWVKNLIFIVLITTFLQLFLPENNMRSYVRVVMGFFIIMILISPLKIIFNQDYDTIYRVLPEQNINNSWEQIKERGEKIEESNQYILNDYYQERVSGRIRSIVDLYFPDYQKGIEVEINDYYQLVGMKIKLYKNKIKAVEIDSVDFDQEKIKTGKSEKDGLGKNIRSRITSLQNKLKKVFQIPIANIEVMVLNRGQVSRGEDNESD